MERKETGSAGMEWVETRRDETRRGEAELGDDTVIIAAHRFPGLLDAKLVSRFANSTRRRTSDTLARLRIEQIRGDAER